MIDLNMHAVTILLSALLLLFAAYIVFRRVIRKIYLARGHLTWLSSCLQLLVFAGLMGFPYFFNPPDWPWFWRLDGPASSPLKELGVALIVLGFVLAFGTMFWFGLRRAFGLEAEALIGIGLYRITRNPQILGGYLLVIGSSVQWPSWYAFVWIALYGLISHWMIITEEEHLRAIFGEEYMRYCDQAPRYLFRI